MRLESAAGQTTKVSSESAPFARKLAHILNVRGDPLPIAISP